MYVCGVQKDGVHERVTKTCDADGGSRSRNTVDMIGRVSRPDAGTSSVVAVVRRQGLFVVGAHVIRIVRFSSF